MGKMRKSQETAGKGTWLQVYSYVLVYISKIILEHQKIWDIFSLTFRGQAEEQQHQIPGYREDGKGQVLRKAAPNSGLIPHYCSGNLHFDT